VSPVAEATYEILRLRVALPEPRVTYRELVGQLRDASEEFEFLYPRSRELYAALAEVEAARAWLAEA
jgi:hypothetical protein